MREREEIIVGNPKYREYKEKFGAIERHEPEEVKALRPKHDMRLFAGALFISLVMNVATCYGLLRETDLSTKANEMQVINDRLHGNQLEELRKYIDRVNYRGGESK